MPPKRKAGPPAIIKPKEPKIITLDQSNLIPMDDHQETAFWCVIRTLFLLWRRQGGKSYTLGAWALMRMMKVAGHLVILCSASLALGKEWVLKEAQVWLKFTQAFRDLMLRMGTPERLVTSADDDKGRLLDVDAVADLFEHQKLQTTVRHSHTVVSRSMVVAPNPDTAVGWTGDVLIDECGRIDCLRELLEAVGPIMTRNRDFMMRLATTISPDDAHFSRQIHGLPVNHPEFPVNVKGNFYVSKTGFTVHRFDAYDAFAAAQLGAEGLRLFDDKSGKEMTPDEHRAAAMDKDAEDRNFFLEETTGGTAAVPAAVLTRCVLQGRGKCVARSSTEPLTFDGIPRLFPPDWQHLLDPQGKRLGLGYDVATTTKKKSNPSAITLMHELGMHYLARLILRFKTEDPAVARAVIDYLLATLPPGFRIGSLCVDATNERFYATDCKKHFAGRLRVIPVSGSETIIFKGEKINLKAYTGGLLIKTAADGYLSLPPEQWIEDDWRLVKNDKGILSADVDESGNHADTFDSTKLGLYSLEQGGPVQAHAAGVTPGMAKPARPGIRSPYAPENQVRRNPTTTLHV